jgi:hypothetical protein
MFPSPSGAGVVVMGGHGADVALKADDQWLLRWESYAPDEACIDAAADLDGDERTGCDDLDCWAVCTPSCPPFTSCDAAAPRCGDGTCSAVETCRMCPGDCGACTAVCGDGWCDAGEVCAGDCP